MLLKSFQLSPEDSHSLISQGTASSQATSILGTWWEAYSSLWEASPSHGAARDLGQGYGRGSQAASQPGCGHTPGQPTAPWAPVQCSLKCSGCNDALGALWFQVRMKLLDTKIPWSGSIPCPRPCTTLPGWAVFLPCSCRDDDPAVEAWCLEHPASPYPGQNFSSSPPEMRAFLLESSSLSGMRLSQELGLNEKRDKFK